jgi:hypothetical protein
MMTWLQPSGGGAKRASRSSGIRGIGGLQSGGKPPHSKLALAGFCGVRDLPAAGGACFRFSFTPAAIWGRIHSWATFYSRER